MVESSSRKSVPVELLVVIAIALLLIFVMPAVLSGFNLNLLGRFLALAIVALGIDLIWGYTGMLSLGHGVFFTLGGYALGMHVKLQLPPGTLPEFMTLYGVTELPWFWKPFTSFPLTILLVFLVPAIIGGSIGYFIFRNRIRGVYFSILTQAITIIFFSLFNGTQKWFNGTNGLTDFKSILGLSLSGRQADYWLYVTTVVTLAIAYGICRWFTSGRFGRVLVAIRDDENRLRFSGYDPAEFKTVVFALSAALAGVSGALYSLQTDIVSPSTMNIAFSIEMVIWVAVGGRATLVGAILGAVLVNFGKSALITKFPAIWTFFQGGLFLWIVLALPDGIVGWWRSPSRTLFQRFSSDTYVPTYPSLAEDPDVEYERQTIDRQRK